MIEGTPSECFLHAVQESWSGCIDVKAPGGEAIGQVVFSKGRIAWATCRGQSETLGILLWRLGRISREQLLEVQRIYKENEGRKKLGVILEEEGFMSRAVLRRCLLLHTRAAVEGILSQEADALAVMIDGAQKTDERILFGPEEVLPEHFFDEFLAEWRLPDNTMVRSWRRRTPRNAIFDELMTLPESQGAAVISFDGGVLTARLNNEEIDLKVLAVLVSAIMESSSRAAKASGLEKIQTMMIDCPGGWIMACWLDEMRHHSLLLISGEQGDPILARHSIEVLTPQIGQWLLEHGDQSSDDSSQQIEGQTQQPMREEAESASKLEHRSRVLREWGQAMRQDSEHSQDEDRPAGDMSEALERLVRK